MHPDWARTLRDQCAAADVVFNFKQWGEWLPGGCNVAGPEWPHGRPDRIPSLVCHMREPSEEIVYRVGKDRAGKLLDGVKHLERPSHVKGK